MTVCFLQSRLDSSRFPRKALATLGDRSVTAWCLSALEEVEVDAKVLLTEPESEAELSAIARSHGWDVFVGSKLDVLDRFVQAARAYRARTIVRATGDNPLVSGRWANVLLRRHADRRSHYSGYVGAPVGSGVEIVDVEALESAWAQSSDAYEREHVSPFVYRRPERFTIDRPEIDAAVFYPEGRITLDTPDDFEYLSRIFREYRPTRPIELEELIPWLRSNPRL